MSFQKTKNERVGEEKSKRIYLSSPHMSDEGFEEKYVKEAFDTNWITCLGSNLNKFEKDMVEKAGTKAATALSSGTAAIHMALKSVGVGKDDIVLCQSFTFSATANPIIYQNAKPVFIDSDYETWNMSPVALRKAFEKYAKADKDEDKKEEELRYITKNDMEDEIENEIKNASIVQQTRKLHSKIKAVIVVHLYGIPANLDEIVAICKEYHTPLIEDAAESLGSLYKGKHTGTFGEYGIYSFNGNKIITTSGGGMLVHNGSDAEAKMEKVRFWSTQSKEIGRHYEHKEVGFNYRMSNVVAGIGRGQLKVLDQRVSKKQYIFSYYKEAFKDIPEISMMPVGNVKDCNCWLSCIVLTGKIKPIDVILALEAEDIEARPVWKPLHMQPFFEGCDYISNGDVVEDIFARGVCLPSDSKMGDGELERVAAIVKKLFEI